METGGESTLEDVFHEDEIEEYYKGHVQRGWLYPSLDTLVEQGLVEQGLVEQGSKAQRTR